MGIALVALRAKDYHGRLKLKLYSKSTTNPQLFSKSTTNPQHLDMSRCCGFVVDSTTNPQQIETVEYGFRLVHNKSKSCTTNAQQIHNFTASRTARCTTNPQQIHNKSNKWSLSFKGGVSSIYVKFSTGKSFFFFRTHAQPISIKRSIPTY
jgi:hypothetical protein